MNSNLFLHVVTVLSDVDEVLKHYNGYFSAKAPETVKMVQVGPEYLNDKANEGNLIKDIMTIRSSNTLLIMRVGTFEDLKSYPAALRDCILANCCMIDSNGIYEPKDLLRVTTVDPFWIEHENKLIEDLKNILNSNFSDFLNLPSLKDVPEKTKAAIKTGVIVKLDTLIQK